MSEFMSPVEVKSVAEHWDLLFWLLVVVLGAAYGEFRYAFRNMCKRQKEFIEVHHRCQRELPGRFLGLEAFKEYREELKQDRDKRWEKHFWPHVHREDESVKVPNPE